MKTGKFIYHQGDAPKEPAPELLFATPLLKRRPAVATREFLARVKAYVLDLKTRDPGVKVSNLGGWHSSDDLFDTEDETMSQLAEALLAATAEMSYYPAREINPECAIAVAFRGSWANVSRDGDFNKPHMHPGTLWSGVFYVDAGERDRDSAETGNIEFMDPRPANHNASKHSLRPRPGQVLIFPSWLTHYVNPFRGRGERISIAFNADVKISRPEGAQPSES
jgi:uncharacterized protein (TIGR02466 family)